MATLNVTVNEARDQLAELLARAAAGDRVVITDGEKPSAELTPLPPVVSCPKAEAEAYGRRIEFIRMVIQNHEQDGNPLPADDGLRRLVAEWDEACK